MQATTERYKNLIMSPHRHIVSEVVIGTQTYGDDEIVSWDYVDDVNPSDSLILGAVASKELTVELVGPLSVTIAKDTPVTVRVGVEQDGVTEWIKLHEFLVYEVTNDRLTTRLLCYDAMIKAETGYITDKTFPRSLRAVVQDACNIAGITLANATIIPTTQVEKLEGYTCREIISYAAAFVGGFAKINRDGALEIQTYQNTDYEVNNNMYFEPLTIGDKVFKLNHLECHVDSETTLEAGESFPSLAFENPFMTQARLDTIFSNLSTLEYMPYEAGWRGDPAIDAGDKITLVDEHGESYPTLVMQQTLTYTGGLSGTIAAFGKHETAQAYRAKGPAGNVTSRLVTDQALIKKAVAEHATIQQAIIEDLDAQQASITALSTDVANINLALIDKAEISDLDVIYASIQSLDTNKASITDLQAEVARIDNLYSTYGNFEVIVTDHMSATTASINTIVTNAAIAELLQAGQIIAGSSIIAEGAIGSAHISELNADLLSSGSIDTSKITIRDEAGRFRISDNKLQVFDYTDGDTPALFERVALGRLDETGTLYGLRIRGDDGTTLLIDETGITEEGFTDGYDKLPNNTLNPIKIDIDSVITRINNDGTQTIEGSKILLNNKTLDVEIFDINTKQSELETITSNNTASITANTEAINLKLDSQTFDNYKTETDGEIDSINTNLQTKTTEISALQGQIILKAEQTDLEALETITNGISSNVESLQTQTAGIEIELGSIESRVSNTETSISSLNTRISTAESSISQNTTEIELRVTATEMEEMIETVREDINELSGETGSRISLIESEILVHSDEINLSVKRDDITHKNIWGINYASNLPENWEQGFNDGVNVDTNPYYISNIGFIHVNPNTDYTLFIEDLATGTTWEELSLMTWAEVAQNTWGSYLLSNLLSNVRNYQINITEYDANDNILNETWEGIEFIFNKDTPYPVSFTTQEGTEKIKMRIKAQDVEGLELEINPAAVKRSNLKLEIGATKTDWLPCIYDIEGEHQLNAINYEEEPIEPVAGTLWLDAQNNINLYKFNGVEWVLVGFGTVENIMTKMSSNEAQLKILDDRLNIEISSLKEGQEEINTYFNFEEDGLKIGKSDSPFDVGISHERFEINKDNVPIVWISGQQEKLFIKSVEVTEDLIVGNHAIEKYDENLTLVRWIGGDA